MKRTKPASIPDNVTEIILESISDGVFTVDHAWRIMSFNRAAEKITGIPRQDAIGRHCWEVFRSNMCEKDCALKRTMQEGATLTNTSTYIVNSAKKRIPIDVSTAPGLEEKRSVAYAFEHLGLGKFGAPGTLAIAATVTSALKNLHLRTTGYTGLMLPLLEDVGLVERFDEGVFAIENLMLYSTVCGIGLDAVPIPGDVEPEKVAAILLDIAALSVKLQKPLSARLLPFPGKKAGERTDYQYEYLLDSSIPELH